MDVLDDLGCDLGGALFAPSDCSGRKKDILTKVMVQMSAGINVMCGGKETVTQNTTCSAFAKNCPGMSVQCENQAYISQDCKIEQQAQAAVAAMMSSLDDEITRTIANVDKNAPPETVSLALNNMMNNACDTSQKTSQTINSSIVCNLSKHVDMSAVANANETSACVMTTALDLANKAIDATNPRISSKTKSILVITAISILFVAFLVVLVFLIRSSGGMPQATQVIYAEV